MNEIVQNKLSRIRELSKNSALKSRLGTLGCPSKRDGLSMVIKNQKEAEDFMRLLEVASGKSKKQ